MAVSRDQPWPTTVEASHDPETIVLDFVNSVGAAGRRLGEGW
jgi:hypothetical protein